MSNQSQGAPHPAYSAPSSAPPFALPPPDYEPLPPCTRTFTAWNGHTFTEHDPATGAVVATGEVEVASAYTHTPGASQ